MDKAREKMLLKRSLIDFISNQACFDLQFRKDVKHNRPNKPVYYSWKAQFVIVGKYGDEDLLREVQELLNCGQLHFLSLKPSSQTEKTKQGLIRYSVQSVDHLCQRVVPFFRKLKLSGNKKQDFDWWSKAVEIIFQNKGKSIHPFKSGKGRTKENKWKRQDFSCLIEIQKNIQKYKSRKTQSQKWLFVAESISKALE